MAKLDTTLIEGYDNMTPEQKVAALESLEYEDHAAELEKTKNALTKANGDAAEWKRKHNALLTEDELKRQKEAEERQSIMDELNTLRAEKLISGYKASYMANGYDEALAEQTARALAAGEMDTVFANQKTFQEAHDKALKAQLMGGTPKPAGDGGDSGKGMTKEAFLKLPPLERQEYAKTHPDEYKQLYGGYHLWL